MYVYSLRWNFRLSNHLVNYLGLSVAYKSADLLHQDISEGNIMMTADGRGLVNDWEIAAKIGGHCVSCTKKSL